MTDAAHPDTDDLVALALGLFDGDQERLTEHLAGCTACRRDYDEYAASVALVLPAAPRTAPPADFQVRVLDRLQRAAAGPATERHAAVSVAEPRRPRRWLLPAAAALAGMAIGAGAISWWPGGDAEVPPPSVTEQWHTALVTADGREVGRVSTSYGADGPVLVLEVTDGPAGQRYTCRLVLADGSTQDVAEWPLADDRPNSWVIDAVDGEVVEVQLITPDERVWSAARL